MASGLKIRPQVEVAFTAWAQVSLAVHKNPMVREILTGRVVLTPELVVDDQHREFQAKTTTVTFCSTAVEATVYLWNCEPKFDFPNWRRPWTADRVEVKNVLGTQIFVYDTLINRMPGVWTFPHASDLVLAPQEMSLDQREQLNEMARNARAELLNQEEVATL